ncbi:MAG: hypothetical protein ACR5LF_14675 [Symbiopectobacterium sp.]
MAKHSDQPAGLRGRHFLVAVLQYHQAPCAGEKRQYGNTLFFFAVSVVLWIQYTASSRPPMAFSLTTGLELLFYGSIDSRRLFCPEYWYSARQYGIARDCILILFHAGVLYAAGRHLAAYGA